MKNSRFDFLRSYNQELADFACKAEESASLDPQNSLLKLRGFLELLIPSLYSINGLQRKKYNDRIYDFDDKSFWRIFPPSILSAFHEIRKSINTAVHPSNWTHPPTSTEALAALDKAYIIAQWYDRYYGQILTFQYTSYEEIVHPPRYKDKQSEIVCLPNTAEMKTQEVNGNCAKDCKLSPIYYRVEALELTVGTMTAIKNAGINLIGELVTKTESELLKSSCCGRKSLKEMKEVLLDMGLTLGMNLVGFPDPVVLANSIRERQTDIKACYVASCENYYVLGCNLLRVSIGIDGICQGYKSNLCSPDVFCEQHAVAFYGNVNNPNKFFLMYRSVEVLVLPVLTKTALKNAGIKLIGELVTKTGSELMAIDSIGIKSLKEIKDMLSYLGLALGTTLDGFPNPLLLPEMMNERETDIRSCYVVTCQNNYALGCILFRTMIGINGICLAYKSK